MQVGKEARASTHCAWPGCRCAAAERGLELVAQRGMGPAAPLLLLRVLALLRFGDGDRLREGYARLQRLVTNSLEDAAKRDPAGLGPQGVLGCYEAWAAMDLAVTPPKSSLVGLRLRGYLRGSKLSARVSGGWLLRWEAGCGKGRGGNRGWHCGTVLQFRAAQACASA
jgi:hypothetical protein